MHWLAWLLLLLVTTLLQVGVVNVFDPRVWGQPILDLYLVLALAYGLRAPADDAKLAGFFTGLTRDLFSFGVVGLHALALGTALLALVNWRDVLRINVWSARFLLALVAGAVAQLIIVVYRYYWLQNGEPLIALLTGALLTATIAAGLAATLVRPARHRRSAAAGLRRG